VQLRAADDSLNPESILRIIIVDVRGAFGQDEPANTVIELFSLGVLTLNSNPGCC
jgi:hypothetical protein